MEQKTIKVSDLQDFDVLFCVGDGILSKAITTATASDFSHAAHFRLINGKAYVVDAQKNGLSARPWDEWVKEFDYRFIALRETNLTALKLATYNQLEFDLLGTRYDFESLAIRHPKKIITRLLNKVRKNQNDDWKERPESKEIKRLYCSEHIATVRGFAEKQLTPKELLTECMVRGYKQVK